MLTFATGYSDAEKGTTMANTVETSEAKPHDVGHSSPLTPAVGHVASVGCGRNLIGKSLESSRMVRPKAVLPSM